MIWVPRAKDSLAISNSYVEFTNGFIFYHAHWFKHHNEEFQSWFCYRIHTFIRYLEHFPSFLGTLFLSNQSKLWRLYSVEYNIHGSRIIDGYLIFFRYPFLFEFWNLIFLSIFFHRRSSSICNHFPGFTINGFNLSHYMHLPLVIVWTIQHGRTRYRTPSFIHSIYGIWSHLNILEWPTIIPIGRDESPCLSKTSSSPRLLKTSSRFWNDIVKFEC